MATAPTPPPVDVDDDDPDEFPCYRHPNRLTALQCVECERPICTECAVAGAVGLKCPDDARISKAARAAVPTGKLVAGVAAGSAVALVLGSALAIFGISFFGIILGYLIGMATGRATRAASGGFRDPALARAAASAAFVGIILLPALGLIAGDAVDAGFLFKVIAAAAAAYGAQRSVLD